MGRRHKIVAQLVGILSFIHAEEGARVGRGDHVLDIECMKTLFPFEAPADGFIHYTAQLGETVGEGQQVAYVESED